MNTSQFTRWLRKQGVTVSTKKGTGHVALKRGERRSVMPTHGGRKQLGKGLIAKIKKDLGLE